MSAELLSGSQSPSVAPPWRRQWPPLQYSCLENPMGGGAWQAAVHGVATSRTRLSDFTLTFHFDALEKEMTTHPSILAWRIPGRGSLAGCRLWGRTESDTTEAASRRQQQWPLPFPEPPMLYQKPRWALGTLPKSGEMPQEIVKPKSNMAGL